MQIPEGAAWIGAQMETLFYFCLRKTSSADEAAELSQDIALAALDALHRGAKIDHMPGWFWQIARNRYARWADRRHKRRDSTAESDITAYELADSDGDLSDAMVRAEELSILRRELAFVRREYREILVAYYLENRPIRDIASSLSLSVNAVQQRLSRARKTVKEGMDMAREFGVRSYQPENVNFTMNGIVGKKGQPWTILTHLLYKNIFLELSGNPETAEEVSIALGIALPYMEDELSFLVREQLLKKSGDRYETDFPIVSREEQRAVHEKSLAVAGPLTDTLCAIVDTYTANGGAKARFAEIGYENAKWALLARVFDELECAEYAKNPDRPDDGAWTVTGYEIIDWEEPHFVGMHGGLTYEETEAIQFWQYKFQWQNLWNNTPTFLTVPEAQTLRDAATGHADKCDPATLARLISYGYLRRDGDRLTPLFVRLDPDAAETYGADVAGKLHTLAQKAREMFRENPKLSRGYVIDEAIARGWLRYDGTLPCVGAYLVV